MPTGKRPQKTKQQPKIDPGIFNRPDDQLPAASEPQSKGQDSAPSEPKLKKAGQAGTLKATSNITPTDDMRNMLGKLRDIEIDPNLPDYPEPTEPPDLPTVYVTPKNLPAIAHRGLMAAGVQDPEFHQVANLPGNMSAVIRQLGKSLFNSLTKTPTEKIYMVADLGGMGPNTQREVNAVLGFLRDHGSDLGPGDVDFAGIMPGYTAQTHQYSALGIRWLVVKDFAGNYIYSWPENDSRTALANKATDTKALPGNKPKLLGK